MVVLEVSRLGEVPERPAVEATSSMKGRPNGQIMHCALRLGYYVDSTASCGPVRTPLSPGPVSLESCLPTRHDLRQGKAHRLQQKDSLNQQ